MSTRTATARIVRFALRNFWRDIWLSTVTIVTFVLAITLVSTLSGVKVVADQAITILRSKVDVTVAFAPGTSESIVRELQGKLQELPETTSVTSISAAENQAQFRQAHANDPILREAIEAVEQNPFGPSLKVQARSLDEYPKISKLLEDDRYASHIASDPASLDRNEAGIAELSRFTRTVERFSIVLTVIFALIAIFVVMNTFRIAIYAHREEIGIMKLVGATNSFVRGPFLIESVLIGLLAAALASALLLLGIAMLSGWFDALFRGTDVHVAAYLTSNFLRIFWGPLLGAIVLSITSASIAVGRYLKV